ncbi:MAG: hypothetical protein SNJ75_04220, partial [Gemmataceae bacterium]
GSRMRYQITINQVCQDQLAGILIDYLDLRRAEEVYEAARTLLHQIRTAPHETGEMAYWLPSGRPVYSVACAPVRLYYAVYEAEKVIWIFRVMDMNETGTSGHE